MTLFQMAFDFILYSFVGWVIEVIYHAVTQGKVVNRGMLNGPVCPIYGCGVVGAFLIAKHGAEYAFACEPSELNGFIIFLGGMLLCTMIELVTGALLDTIFHMRWWDYREKPFNLNGYICLEFSIIWGLAMVFVIKVLYPSPGHGFFELVPNMLTNIVLILCYIALAADLVVTVLMIRRMEHRLGELDEVQKMMRAVSDKLSVMIGEGTLGEMQRLDEGRLQAALAKAELRDAISASEKERMADLAKKKRDLELMAAKLSKSFTEHEVFGLGRFVSAFPGLKHDRLGSVKKLIAGWLDARHPADNA